jgi:hypothetical protein
MSFVSLARWWGFLNKPPTYKSRRRCRGEKPLILESRCAVARFFVYELRTTALKRAGPHSFRHLGKCLKVLSRLTPFNQGVAALD